MAREVSPVIIAAVFLMGFGAFFSFLRDALSKFWNHLSFEFPKKCAHGVWNGNSYKKGSSILNIMVDMRARRKERKMNCKGVEYGFQIKTKV